MNSRCHWARIFWLLKSIPEATEWFQKKSNFRNFSCANNSNFGGFFWGGGAWPGYRGIWVPWVLECLYCHRMTTQSHPAGNRRVSENVELGRVGRRCWSNSGEPSRKLSRPPPLIVHLPLAWHQIAPVGPCSIALILRPQAQGRPQSPDHVLQVLPLLQDGRR